MGKNLGISCGVPDWCLIGAVRSDNNDNVCDRQGNNLFSCQLLARSLSNFFAAGGFEGEIWGNLWRGVICAQKLLNLWV